MTAAEAYAAAIDVADAQRERVLGVRERVWAGATARRLRFDPSREPSANVSVLASYLEPGDTLLDVGGGAGRFALPLARRCRQAIVVDPSPGMRNLFEASAAEAGIANTSYIPADWLSAGAVEGDVSLVAHVTYFVREIVPFLDKLAAASRRRVLIYLESIPPPIQTADFFRLVYGEELEPVPGHPELLAVLWEMGILPDVRVLPEPPPAFPTRDAALERALNATWLRAEDRAVAGAAIEQHFDALYVAADGGFRIRRAQNVRELLITWDTNTVR